MNKITLSLLMAIFFLNGMAQTRKPIQGKILVKDAKLSEVHVINLNSEQEVTSDAKGEFIIEVQADDLLVFSGSHLDYMRKIIEEEDIKKGWVNVEMTSKSMQLEEVEIVNYNRINAVSLGILSKPAKKYTVAERRLYGATSSPLDGLLNSLSGRTAMLKNDILTEKKQLALEELEKRYTDEFYTQTLKISQEDIGGFKYFVVEDFKFNEALKDKNSFRVTFLMIKLAIDYKEIRNAK